MPEILWGLGFAACHQLPTHSLFCGTDQIPWCARCSGFYWGAFIAIIFLALFRTIRAGRPPLPVVIILGLGTILLAADALSDMFGWRSSTGFTRLGSGLWMGLSIPPLLWSWIARHSGGDENRAVVGYSWLMTVFGSAGLILWLGLTAPQWAWWLLAGGTALGQIGLWGLVNVAVMGLIITEGRLRWFWIILIAFVFLLLELLLLGMIHLALLGLVMPFTG